MLQKAISKEKNKLALKMIEKFYVDKFPKIN
jgi:hypothetical protein